jgi:regulator of protease activity HflC (stomatin/prohibitin superfamily)
VSYRQFDDYKEALMADIQHYPFVRHLRGTPTVHIRHQRRGKIVHDGVAQAFWFRPLAAVLSEVPVDDRELPLLFHARTRDFQDVTVQATLTFRIADAALAAARLDFSIDPDTGRWRSAPLDQVAGLLTELAQQHTLEMLAAATLEQALADGPAPVRDRVSTGLAGDQRLVETGITLIGVRIVAIRPEADVERALQTPTREAVQQEADRATYERRAVAVEHERAIGENELQSQIELAKREEQLVAQRGQNDRRRAEEAAAASGIETQARAERDRVLANAKADTTRLVGAATADAEAARLTAYRDTETDTLLALALQELAGALPQIGTLNITPDLLTAALGRLTSTTQPTAPAETVR